MRLRSMLCLDAEAGWFEGCGEAVVVMKSDRWFSEKSG
jgi:hypothetical protein